MAQDIGTAARGWCRMDRYGLVSIMKVTCNFGMGAFPGRLPFQKTTHRLRPLGAYLSYSFGRHLHGTCNPALARDGFSILDITKKVAGVKLRFVSAVTQDRYDMFKEFEGCKNDDPALLEIGASICYLATIKLVENKKVRFAEAQCARMRDELEKYEVVKA